MKRMILAAAAALLAVFMTGCSKDNSGDSPVIDPVEPASYTGTLKVTSDGVENTTENVHVSVSFQENGTVDILFHKVKFVPQMPVTLDVTVPGVSSEAKDGVYHLSGEDIIPVAMGMPYEKFKVTGLSGTLNEDIMSLSLNFGQYPTSYSGVLAPVASASED